MLYTHKNKTQQLPRSFKTPGGTVLPLRQQFEQGLITLEELADYGFTPHVAPVPAPPTQQELLEQIRQECGSHIEHTLGWTDRIQRSVIAGIYSQVIKDAMTESISLSIAESNRCEDLILAGSTATPAWPTAADGALSWEEAKQL